MTEQTFTFTAAQIRIICETARDAAREDFTWDAAHGTFAQVRDMVNAGKPEAEQVSRETCSASGLPALTISRTCANVPCAASHVKSSRAASRAVSQMILICAAVKVKVCSVIPVSLILVPV
jgi:hypothetical protein